MNNEIKEIDITKDLYLCSPLLNTKCPKKSCYINNGSCWHTVNKEYSQEHLLDYITNLQQENKKLEDTLTRITASDGETTTPVLDLVKENERLKEENKYLDELRNANYLSWQDSLSRIEKAVEELELWQPKIESLKLEKEYLLDILNGRSDE